jgi:hypothetical protein
VQGRGRTGAGQGQITGQGRAEIKNRSMYMKTGADYTKELLISICRGFIFTEQGHIT